MVGRADAAQAADGVAGRARVAAVLGGQAERAQEAAAVHRDVMMELKSEVRAELERLEPLPLPA